MSFKRYILRVTLLLPLSLMTKGFDISSCESQKVVYIVWNIEIVFQ